MSHSIHIPHSDNGEPTPLPPSSQSAVLKNFPQSISNVSDPTQPSSEVAAGVLLREYSEVIELVEAVTEKYPSALADTFEERRKYLDLLSQGFHITRELSPILSEYFAIIDARHESAASLSHYIQEVSLAKHDDDLLLRLQLTALIEITSLELEKECRPDAEITSYRELSAALCCYVWDKNHQEDSTASFDINDNTFRDSVRSRFGVNLSDQVTLAFYNLISSDNGGDRARFSHQQMKRLLDYIGARISLITPHPTKSELSAFETREDTLRPQLEHAQSGAESLSRLSLPTCSLEKEVQLAVQLKTLLTLIRERPIAFHSEEARTVLGEVRAILSNVDLLASLLHQVVTDSLDVSSIKLPSWTPLMGTVANDLLRSDAKALLNKQGIRQGLVDSVGHFAFNHPHAGIVISVARKWKENLDLLNLTVDPAFSESKEQIQKLLGEVRFKKANVSTNSESLTLLLDDSVAVLGFLSDKHKCSGFCSSLQTLLKNYEVV